MQSYSLPSDSHVELTIGASGAYYTAPADGWLRFTAKSNNASFAHVQLYGRVAMRCPVTAPGAFVAAFVPVYSGESFAVDYTNVNDKQLMFYYSKGSAPQS